MSEEYAAEVDPLFGHVKLNADGQARYRDIGVAFTAALRVLRATGGDSGPDGTLAIRSLQVARMWASRALITNPANVEA